MCLYPTLIKNRRYTRTKKNGGVIPPCNDKRTLYVPIGCQQCIECKKQKARGWQVRLLEEIKTAKTGRYITLTFNTKSLIQLKHDVNDKLKGYDLDNAIATLAVRRFLERWRAKYKKSLRHWLVTELGHGQTEHVHLHGIIWVDKKIKYKNQILSGLDEIEKIWKYGFVWKGNLTQKGTLENYVNERTIAYITKYVTKVDEQHSQYHALVLTSPGMGSNYTKTYNAKNNKFKGPNTVETYRTTTGHKIAMPIYWRNKVYNDPEREQLWLNRLDKQERWICGERVSIKKTERHYYTLLEFHRKRNQRLGYGMSNQWEKKQYENQRRQLMHEQRLGNCLAVKRQRQTEPLTTSL